MEFDEVRAYQYGDDMRSIDWNVSARQGHLYVKRYVEEAKNKAEAIRLARDLVAVGPDTEFETFELKTEEQRKFSREHADEISKRM